MAPVPRPAQLTVAAAVLLAATVYSVAVLARPGRLAAESQRWPGHYTLLARVQDSPAGDVRGALRAAAARLASRWSVVSRFTSFESVNAFARFERVRVADLPMRLDDVDPRFDPHLRALPGLFSAVSSLASADSSSAPRSRFEVLYLRSDQSPLAVLLSARVLLRGSGVKVAVAELALGNILLSLLLLVVAVAVARLVVAGSGALLWIAALPHLAVVLASDVGVAAVGAALYVFAFWLAPVLATGVLAPNSQTDSLRRRWRAGLASAALIAAIVLLRALSGALVLAWSIQLATLLLASAASTLRGRRGYLRIVTPRTRARIRATLAVTRRPRIGAWPQLQGPVTSVWRRLTGYRERLPRGRPRLLPPLLLAATCALALPLVAALPDSDPTLVASPPQGTPREPVSSLSKLAPLSEQPVLPSMATLVSHVAYQTALPYGASYRLPALGEALLLPRFTLTANGEVESWVQELRTFDDHWLQELVGQPEHGSVLSLLSSVGDAQPVLAPAGSGAQGGADARVLGVAAALLLIAAATLTRLSRCATTAARPGRTVGGKADGSLLAHPARLR